MKTRFVGVVLAALLAAVSVVQAQQMKDAVAKIHRERIQSSYLIAFGRLAADAEVAYWSQQNPKSVSELVTRHNEYLQRDQGTHRDTIQRSYQHAFGRPAKDGEINHWMSGSDNYTELMKKHVQWLRDNPAQYDEVLRLSYQRALGRPAKNPELNWWKAQGTFSFAMLAAAHEDWAKRNGANGATPSGRPLAAVNSRHLTIVPVSPAVAQEAIAAARLIGNDGGSIVGNAGGNIVGNAGGNIVAAGAGNMVAAGGGNIVAAGAGN